MSVIDFLENKNFKLNFIFHLLLGIASAFSKFIFILFFYLIILTSLKIIFNPSKNKYFFIYLICYVSSFEVLGRILNCSPFIPYELSKYFQFILFSFGIISFKKNNPLSLFLLLLLLPGFFIDKSGMSTFNNVVFNIIGTLNLVMGLWCFSDLKFQDIYLQPLLRFLLLPLITTLILSIIKTPSLDNLTFDLGANKSFSAGFGSNQVSTIYGVGFFLTSIFLIFRYKLSGYLIIDYVILFLFLGMGLLTFSRGGMIGGFLSLIIVVFFSSQNSLVRSYINKNKNSLIYLFFGIFVIFYLINSITDNSLLLRYQGYTNGIIYRDEKVSLSKLTTGRFDILLDDFRIFKNNFFGVGIGASSYLRDLDINHLSHIELGRLLSEHGLLGFIFFLILILVFFKILVNAKSGVYNSLLLSFIVLSLFTSFHSATRTFVTPLFFALGSLRVFSFNTNLKKKVKNQIYMIGRFN